MWNSVTGLADLGYNPSGMITCNIIKSETKNSIMLYL